MVAIQLTGKVALVTGAGSGIGRATALAFAQEGAKVVVADVDAVGGEETVKQITQTGGEAIFVATDVSRADDVQRLVSRTVEVYGRLDCAHNNAGISVGGRTHDIAEDAWARVLAVNLTGVFLCMKYEIVQLLAQGGGGAIVNTASVLGLVGGGSVTYVASKHGVVGLTKHAALEYAQRGIRINAVCPAPIPTPLLARAFARTPGLEERWLASVPLGRFGTPEEVAAATVWLCSDAASFVTGVAMPVDGGWLAQ
jgi:NAD(P)-dependent dehydrogenase (short-subunit alcohol dehydrogenase family)